MSDASEPTWTDPVKEIPTEATAPDPRQPTSRSASPDSSRPDRDQPSPKTSGDSSPESARPDPQALVTLISEGIKAAASMATWLTRKRLGLQLQVNDGEARAISKPLARLIARRYNVKSDLNDAVDTVGTGAALMNYFERVTNAAPPGSAGNGYRDAEDRRPAARPAPEANLLSDERPSPAPSAAPPSSPSKAGKYEVGSGPVRDAYLAGYE